MTTPPRRAKRRYIVIPFVIFGLLFAAYSAVWVYGAGVMEDEVDAFIADQRAMGNAITYDSRKIKGYPLSLRTQLDNFTWADPGEWSWSGERLYVVTLPYDVTRIILSPRKSQTVEYGGVTYAIEGMVNVGLKQDAYSAEGNDVVIDDGTQSLGLGTFRGNLNYGENGTWEFLASVRQAIFRDPSERNFEVPYWNLAITGEPTNQVNIQGSELAVTDGTKAAPTLLGTSGLIGVDGFNQLDGTLSVSIRNEQALLSVLERYDLATADQLQQAKTVLSAMTNAGTTEAAVPFTFKDGAVFIYNARLATIGAIY